MTDAYDMSVCEGDHCWHGIVCCDCDLVRPLPPPDPVEEPIKSMAEVMDYLRELRERGDGSLSRAIGVGWGIMTDEDADELGWGR